MDLKADLNPDSIVYKSQDYLCCPGYNDSDGTGKGERDVAKGHPPKPRGAVWIRFDCDEGELREEISLAT